MNKLILAAAIAIFLVAIACEDNDNVSLDDGCSRICGSMNGVASQEGSSRTGKDCAGADCMARCKDAFGGSISDACSHEFSEAVPCCERRVKEDCERALQNGDSLPAQISCSACRTNNCAKSDTPPPPSSGGSNCGSAWTCAADPQYGSICQAACAYEGEQRTTTCKIIKEVDLVRCCPVCS